MNRELASEKTKMETGLEHVFASLNILTPYGRKKLRSYLPFMPGQEEDLRREFKKIEDLQAIVKSDKTLVVVKQPGEFIETGRKKFGAVLGDYVEIGCNSVLNPGTVVGRRSSVYPTSCVRGVIPADSIYKDKVDIVLRT